MANYDKEIQSYNDYDDMKTIKLTDPDVANIYVEEQVMAPNNLENAVEDVEVVEGPPPKRRYLYLEIPIFLINFAANLTATVYTNQLLFQSCKNIFHFDVEDCEPMLGIKNATEISKQLEDQVQPYVSKIIMTNSLISAIIPAILSLFVGPWADKFGRRPVLITTFSAAVVGYVIITIIAGCSAKSDVDPWLYILYSIPLAVCGGTCSMMTIVYCCISDWATPQVKAIRMFYNDAAIGLGLALGSLASSYLFAATSATAVFGISLAIAFVSLVYIIVFVDESLKPELIHTGSKVKGFFNYKLLVELGRTCIERRPKFDRSILWLTIISLVILNFITQGESNVFYLFLVKKFDLSFRTYSDYNSINSGVQIVGGVLGLEVFGKLFKLSIVTITAMSLLLSTAESIIRTLAQQFWEMYLAMGIGFMAGITGALLLAVISMITPRNQVGKVYALTTALQTIMPLASSPLYTSVYNSTIATFPGLFNVISACLYFVCFVLTSSIFGIQRYTKDIVERR